MPETQTAESAPAIRQFTKAERILALKSFADRWVVVAVDGANWWCDGSAIIACEEGPGMEFFGRDLDSWKRGISGQPTKARTCIAGGATDGYRIATGTLVGSFTRGYFRRYSETYINERYARAFGPDAAVWVSGATKPAIITDQSWNLLGVVMPVVNRNVCTHPMEAMPEIPFLEDEALYHECKDED